MAARQLALDQSKKVCGNFLRREPDHFGFLSGREQDFLVSQEQAVALVTTFTYLNTDGSVYLWMKRVISLMIRKNGILWTEKKRKEERKKSVKVGPPIHNYEHEAGSYGDGFT